MTTNSNIAKVNGEEIEMEVKPHLVCGRTMVPLRFVSESIGAKVDWDDENRVARVNF